MRKLFLAVALTFSFALSASAGEIECGVKSPPPPQVAASTEGGVVEALAMLLQSVLSVF